MATQDIIDKINAHVPKGGSVKDSVVREVLLEIITEITSAVSDVAAADVNVDAYPAGSVTAGDLQTVINALADRIEALETP